MIHFTRPISYFCLLDSHHKPSWWIALLVADDKANRLVVPPLKISDIPYSRPDADRNYRAFKIQFQCPPNTGLFTWKIYLHCQRYLCRWRSIGLSVTFFCFSKSFSFGSGTYIHFMLISWKLKNLLLMIKDQMMMKFQILMKILLLVAEFHYNYCTISFNSSVTRHGPSKIDEMSRWSRSFWRSDEIFFR